ncbi:MAG: 50S ribosomal protein L4 [Alphaproteobacteria bacterium MarineAlpha9_Bin4]|nr:50S ribosomal protein L4 [Pelagibacterales bacterium]PPR26260.1 MAG: 50S ribosomal protein L4 [Alphaproteobacteria bacterium MarineAlpha9_Bin4]|tara:strand:+ start:192 stop:824 length:633 start_codon:yes stop_codon:yes gene_type:complete
MTSKTKIKVINLDNKVIEDIALSEKVFNCKENKAIIAKLVNWQLANRRQGTHKVKERGEIVGSTAKIYKQKGMGRARHGSKKVVQFKGGGVVHGPNPRSHDYKLNTKLKKSAIRSLLSAKLKEGNLKVVDKLELKSIKTKDLNSKIKKLGIESAIFLEADKINKNFALSLRNIKNIDLISSKGINAPLILKRKTLVLSKEALTHVEETYK